MAGLTLGPGEKDLRRIVDVVRQLMEGRSNAIVTGTLTANATSTTIRAPTCAPTSAILPCPLTPDAANDMATTSYAPAYGQFVITHANNARVDRSFAWIVIG
jgi:hypothetical protein